MTKEVSNKTLMILGALVVVFFAITSVLIWSSVSDAKEITGSSVEQIEELSTETSQDVSVFVTVIPSEEGETENG